MKILTVAAIAACKLCRLVLRLAGRGGTALPGKLALRICPSLLDTVSSGVNTVLVTGTNGKTTTCRMIEQIFADQGLGCFANRSGANLASGITAEFAANAALTGRPKRQYAVIECDEGALKQVAGALRPRAVVVTNLFRDQLDRYGELMRTREAIFEGIKKVPGALLCLNADCSLTASLALAVENRTLFYGLGVQLDGAGQELSDAPRCIRCGTQYGYSYGTYAHLGGFFCPKCGYSRPECDIEVTSITEASHIFSTVEMSVRGQPHTAEIGLPAAYNIYNAAAAVAAAVALDIPSEDAIASLADIKSGFGRMESFQLDGVTVRMILVKNPAGCNQALSFLRTVPGDYLPVFCLNDNTADGTDISWIWDTDYELLLQARQFERIVIWGGRAEELALRLKYAGAGEESIVRASSLDELVGIMSASGLPVYALPNYTSMIELRGELGRICGKKKFWE